MAKICAKEVLEFDAGAKPTLLGFGLFATQPDRVCFLAQDQDGRRRGIYFGRLGHEDTARLIGQLMDMEGIRSVRTMSDGTMRWEVRPSTELLDKRGKARKNGEHQ